MVVPPVTIAGRQVQVDIIDQAEADATAALQDLLSAPETLDRRCRAAMLENARTDPDGGTRLYVSHHRDLASAVLQAAIADPETLDLETIAAFLESMSVRGIWATPVSSSAFLHVDRQGAIRSVDMES